MPRFLFVLFAAFLISPNSLATQTEALLTKSARPADSSLVTTTTIEESVSKSGGGIGLNAVCRGQAKAFHALPIGIPKPNCRISGNAELFTEGDSSIKSGALLPQRWR